jgi:hypothetical protein
VGRCELDPSALGYRPVVSSLGSEHGYESLGSIKGEEFLD